MPESFESMLAEMAEAAVSGTRAPSATDVRRRGRQRAVRLRMVVSAAVLTTVCGVIAGGVATKVIGAGPNTAVVPAATYSDSPAPPLPSAAATAPGYDNAGPSASPDASGSGPIAELIMGQWRRTDGTFGELFIYPPGGANQYAVVGISASGVFPLCYGRIATVPAGGQFGITGVTCGGSLASDMSLAYGDSLGTTLVLRIPDSTGKQVDIPFTLASPDTTAAPSVAAVAGTWISSVGTVTVQAGGEVSWTVTSHGTPQSGTGTVTGSFAGGIVVTGPCNPGPALCSVLQLDYSAAKDQLTVIGSAGPQTFTRKS